MKDKFEIDSVKMMRDIRSQLHKKYLRDKKKMYQDLERIRIKYKFQEVGMKIEE